MNKDAAGTTVPERAEAAFFQAGGSNGRRVFVDALPTEVEPGDVIIMSKETHRPDYPELPTPPHVIIVVGCGETITALQATATTQTLLEVLHDAKKSEAMYWRGWGHGRWEVGSPVPDRVRRKVEPEFPPGTLVTWK